MARYARGPLGIALALGAGTAILFLLMLTSLPLLGAIATGLLCGILCGIVARGGAGNGARAGVLAGLFAASAISIVYAFVTPLLPIAMRLAVVSLTEIVLVFQAVALVLLMSAGAAMGAHFVRGAPLPETAAPLLPFSNEPAPASLPSGQLAGAPSIPVVAPETREALPSIGFREKKIRCPACSSVFLVTYAATPHPIECPGCGLHGAIR